MTDELFARTPIPKAYMTLALPVVMSMVVQLVYSMADTFFIALTGDTALIAGISVCTPLFTLLLAFGDLFGLGGSSVIARLFGAGRKADGKRLSIFCFYGAIGFGIVAAVVLLSLREPMLALLGAKGEVIPYAVAYYSWFIAGAPFVIFSLVPTNLLRTAGCPKISMNASILGAAVNIALDPVLIFGLELGAAGAALATVIGYICADIYAVCYIRRHCAELSLDLPALRISWHEAAGIFSIGLAAAVTSFTQTFGIALTNRSLLPYGSDAIAVMGIVMKIIMIVALVVVGLAFGGQPLIGYTYGAKDKARMKKVIAFALQAVIGTSAVLALGLAFFARPVVHVFLAQPALIEQGVTMLYWQLPAIIFMGIGLVLICTFQATGKGLPALMLSLCRQGIVYALALAVLPLWFGYTGVIAAQLAADIVTVVIAAGLYRICLAK